MSWKALDLSHIDKTKVYDPDVVDDSFLMGDTLINESGFLRNILKPTVCVEIGCGSGAVITILHEIMKGLGTDINLNALNCTKKTSSNTVETIRTDLFSGIRTKPDVVVFNPPYVVTDNEELKLKDPLVQAYAGGYKGRVVIDRFLSQLENILGPCSTLYLLLIQPNDVDEVRSILREKGIYSSIIAKRRSLIEQIFILKCSRNIQYVECC
ncbi:putative methylase [Rozella allomycis CSF55]|uniref:DNA methylase, N-6 adenine-specific domain-containing protein n=1 Tax=Rozella allomycis (strain CSF55) TaxID=988480 RepID=A0A075AQU8_ROZAC|nr:DNA methylase, N-6 adenine-specific domain-containing protein [Rozella allomycis CSF55]RKP18449.1 putative methylase [Rozella allomycis CSF55]|eukprot:EPZ32646.1 DNA methylase, N-6 adenine-specific domain-containing protein [Rozella allomycis CSF55]